MAVSKRLRYEIFRRDDHTCRYCGRSAPEVRLTVDHVVAVALGGTDTPDNLVTACGDCNSGKSATPADAAQVAQVQSDALRWSTAIRTAAEQMLADQNQRQQAHGAFKAHWDSWQVAEGALPADWRSSIDSFVGAGLPMAVLNSCLDSAMERKTVATKDVFRYMAGIAWRKVAELHETARATLRSPSDEDEDERAWEAKQPGRADFACQILADLDHDEIMSWLASARMLFDENDEPTEEQVQIEAAQMAFSAYQARLHMAQAALHGLVHSFPESYTAGLTADARGFFKDIGGDNPTPLTVLCRTALIIAEQKSGVR